MQRADAVFHRVPLFLGGVNKWLFDREKIEHEMAEWLMGQADYGDVVVELDRARKVATAYVCGFGDEPFDAAKRALGKCRATDRRGKYMFCDVKPHDDYGWAVARRADEAADRLALEALAREAADRENAAPANAADRAPPAKRAGTLRELQCDKERDRRVWAYDLPAPAGSPARRSATSRRRSTSSSARSAASRPATATATRSSTRRPCWPYFDLEFYRGGALNAGVDGDALAARVVDAAVAELEAAAAREDPPAALRRGRPAPERPPSSAAAVLRVFRGDGAPAPLAGSRAAGVLAARVSAALGPAGVVEAEGRKPTASVAPRRGRRRAAGVALGLQGAAHPSERLLHVTLGGAVVCASKGRPHKSQKAIVTADPAALDYERDFHAGVVARRDAPAPPAPTCGHGNGPDCAACAAIQARGAGT
ncbi:hypothetical protein JL720_5315 [Aureococcus anophagefferens]|nr:hypothetical protein JL720_5315 [Aureococcus anophagefferens]